MGGHGLDRFGSGQGRMACMNTVLYMVCPESIQPINIFKKVTNLEQWYLSPLQSTPLGTSHTFPAFLPLFKTIWKVLFRNRHQLPRRILLNLVCGLKSPFQWQFQFREKPEVTESQIWAVGGLTDLGDAMFYQKSLNESWRMGGRFFVMKMPSPLAQSCCRLLLTASLSRRKTSML